MIRLDVWLTLPSGESIMAGVLIVSDPDPVRERERLAKTIGEIEKTLRMAEELAREKQATLSSAERVAEEARRISPSWRITP